MSTELVVAFTQCDQHHQLLECQQQWQHEQQQRQQLEWRLPLIPECEVTISKGENESALYALTLVKESTTFCAFAQ